MRCHDQIEQLGRVRFAPAIRLVLNSPSPSEGNLPKLLHDLREPCAPCMHLGSRSEDEGILKSRASWTIGGRFRNVRNAMPMHGKMPFKMPTRTPRASWRLARARASGGMWEYRRPGKSGFVSRISGMEVRRARCRHMPPDALAGFRSYAFGSGLVAARRGMRNVSQGGRHASSRPPHPLPLPGGEGRVSATFHAGSEIESVG
jgi:hypothetical protein